ncbi:MAG: dephospho-CoA kinase [Planctomycetota bacterium]
MEKEPEKPGLRVVGILGGVGSGKSTAARLLARRLPGAVLDADAEVARLLGDPGVQARIEAALGGGLRSPEGPLDRRRLGARVFSDPDARRRLEEILHPEVRKAHFAALEHLEASEKAVWALLDVPLLLEKGLHRLCDFLVFVAAPEGVRAARACARHGWSRQEWASREGEQKNLTQKRALADVILENGDDPRRLEVQVDALIPRLKALPPRPLADRWPSWDQEPQPGT